MATGIVFGLRKFTHHADEAVARGSNALPVMPSVRIYHRSVENDGTSESASSRRGGEKGSAKFDWGNRYLQDNVRKMEIAQ